jgi:hypothetical protein
MTHKYGKREPVTKRLEKMRKETLPFKKGQLMNSNHGHKK